MLNRPFPSSFVSLFQIESKCETILMKMTDLHENETACRTHFHVKGFVLIDSFSNRGTGELGNGPFSHSFTDVGYNIGQI